MIPHLLTYRKIHPAFKLNGISFSREDLKEVAYCLIKEGELFEHAIGDFLLDWLSDGKTLVVNTSGSTGAPKTILVEKQKMVNSALATGSYFGLHARDRALLCLPAEYIAGKMMLVRAMVLGLHLDYVKPTSRPLLGSERRYTFGAMVPMQLENSLSEIDRIKILIIGGAPVPFRLREQVQDTTAQIFETYGMTETITHVAIKKINHVGLNPVEAHDGQNLFTALPNITLSLDERGCLIIDAPEITTAPVATNDLVNLISETQFEWLGRYDNVINSGGIKLHPEQIEVKLAPKIESRFLVTGLPDDHLGQKLVLVVEGKVNKEILLQKLEAQPSIKKIELPREIVSVNSFVETENGKVNRAKTIAKIFK